MKFSPEDERTIWRAIDKCGAGEHAFEMNFCTWETSINTSEAEVKIGWFCTRCGQRRFLETAATRAFFT